MSRTDRATDPARWFLRRGLTSLLEGTPVHRGASTRAATALVVLFVLSLLVWVPGFSDNLLVSLAIAGAALLATWIGGNLLRHSPPFSGVDKIGRIEAAVFVLVPAIAVLLAPHEPLVIEGFELSSAAVHLISALVTAAVQLLALGTVLALVEYGVVALAAWLAREIVRSLSTSAAGLTRALPLLLAFVTFSYFGAELWQSFGRLDSWAFLAPVLLFVALSVGFLIQREHLDIEALARFETEDEWRAALSPNPIGAPATHVAGAASGIPAGVRPPRFPAACPLDARQRANLRLVATLSRLVVAGLVGLAVFLVFLVLGLFVVDPALVKAWGGADADIIWQWASSRRTYAVTWENIRVSGFLALFSAFYYAIVSATDASLRQGLADTAHDTVREACARRLALLDAPPRPGRR